jgi:hypothetical protein
MSNMIQMDVNQFNKVFLNRSELRRTFQDSGVYNVYDFENNKFVFRFIIGNEEAENDISLSEFLSFVERKYKNNTWFDGYFIKILKK